MQIHGLCIVKNEADVIEECLEAACEWCDHVYVLDNGSTDGTWQKVRAMAVRRPAIVPFRQDPAPFSDGLRADIFNAFRDRAGPADWWCRLDADEFYVDDPRVFLAKVPPAFDYVVSASFSYYFTDVDARAWEADPLRFELMPVQQRLRHYVNHWSEPRFMRAAPGLAWTRADGGWPASLYTARAWPVRIWVKHFCYRSPAQIEQRLASRRGAIESGVAFGHEALADFAGAVAGVRQSRAGFGRAGIEHATSSWRDRVVPAASLCFDALDRRLEVNESLMPPLPGGFHRPAWRRWASRGKRWLASMWKRAPARPAHTAEGAPSDATAAAPPDGQRRAA
jgi:hypothetical protein